MFQLHSNPFPAHGTAVATEPLEAVLRRLIDEIDCGVIVCDAHGRPLFANQAARRELEDGTLLRLRDGHLDASSAPAAPTLLAAVRGAAQRGKRQMVPLAYGRQHLLASVAPLPANAGAAGFGATQVVVLLGRREPCSALALELFASAHGVTPAERRVLAVLLDEATPREAAEKLGVGLATVRSQIASMRHKLNLHSLEALLLRAAGIPPVAAALQVAARPLRAA